MMRAVLKGAALNALSLSFNVTAVLVVLATTTGGA